MNIIFLVKDIQITDDIKLSDGIIGFGFLTLVGSAIKFIFGFSIILDYILSIGSVLIIIDLLIRKFHDKL